MSKTKLIKVSVEERLPEQSGFYWVETGTGDRRHSYFDAVSKYKNFANSEFITHWLLEVPDREEEMRELLEEYVQAIEDQTIIVKENEDNDGWENFGGRFYREAKQLLNK